MKGQGDQSAYLGDLEYLDHLECLGDVMEGEDDQDDQGTQHSHGR
jgi:hypothetical protein